MPQQLTVKDVRFAADLQVLSCCKASELHFWNLSTFDPIAIVQVRKGELTTLLLLLLLSLSLSLSLLLSLLLLLLLGLVVELDSRSSPIGNAYFLGSSFDSDSGQFNEETETTCLGQSCCWLADRYSGAKIDGLPFTKGSAAQVPNM